MRRIPLLLILLLLFAFWLRVTGMPTNTVAVLADDYKDYHVIASNLLTGNGYAQVEGFAYGRQPGWPLTLTGIYLLGGIHPEIGILFLALFGMLTVGVTYRIAYDIGGKRVGLIATALTAVDPFLIVQDQTLLTESLYTLGLILALWMMMRKRSAIFGALLGLLTLVRSNGLVLLPGLLWVPKKRLALLIMLVILIPWTVRNWAVTGSPSPIAPQNGQILLGAYNDLTLTQPEAFGMWLYPKELPEGAPYADFPYLEREKAWTDQGWQFIHSHIDDLPIMMLRRVARFAAQPAYIPRDGLAGWLPAVQPVYFFILLIGAIAGTILLVIRKKRRFLFQVGSLLLPAIIMAALLYGEARFRAPYHPMFACIAALFYGGSKLRSRYL